MLKRSQGLKWGKGGEGAGEKGKGQGAGPLDPSMKGGLGGDALPQLMDAQEMNGFSMRKAPIVWPWLKSSL
jgi:hypothetical protein